MILLITGASHTGKTLLAQKLVRRHCFASLSIDHLKMGLIRSGQTELKPDSRDADLTAYLWPIVREMIKTAIENGQSMIVEGCYIPFDWKKDFGAEYLKEIRFLCLIMSKSYIRNNWAAICAHANDVERRLDSGISRAGLESDNSEYHKGCLRHGLRHYLIEDAYPSDLGLADFGDCRK